MKPENYEKIISLMHQREKLVSRQSCLNSLSSAVVAIQNDGNPETTYYFYTWASNAKTASLSEKCSAKYVNELKVALAFEISEIDEKLANL